MTDHERDPAASPGDEGLESHETMAGPANTPPFEDPEHADRAAGGRPPSHREFAREAEIPGEAEGMEAIAPASRRRADESERAEGAEADRDAAAEAYEAASNRIGAETADDEAGITGAAPRWSERVAEAREEVADYLHHSGVDDLRALVERQVRERPLQSILLAAATGWLVGKILR